MTGGGDGDAPLIQPAANGGEFLLSLLQRSNSQPQPPQPQQQHQQQQQQPQFPPFIAPQVQYSQHHRHPYNHQQQSVAIDPAVAAVGPSLPINSQPPLWQSNSNGRDLPSQSPRWPHNLGFPAQNQAFPHQGNQFPPPAADQQRVLPDDFQRLGLSSVEIRGNRTIHNLAQQKQQQVEQKLQFGSFSNEFQSPEGLLNANSKLNVVKERELGLGSRNFNGLDRNRQFENSLREQRGRGGGGGWGRQQQNYRSPQPPPGFLNKSRGVEGGGDRNHMSRRRELEHNVNRERGKHSELEMRNVVSNGDAERVRRSKGLPELAGQLDRPGPPAGSNLKSVSAFDIEESLMTVEIVDGEDGKEDDDELDDVGEEIVECLFPEGESSGKKEKKRNGNPKESRSDNRGRRILSQRMRMIKRQVECRRDIDRFNSAFLAIHKSLIPLEEEKAKQKQLFMLLKKLVNKEWPEAELYLYGSCANSFGVSNSDIDVCLAIEVADINKSEVLLKLADILQSDNLQNVQALTGARVPIVKLMDPVTGISCDICINNFLAVVNTKLLRDYAQIDVRLQQLAYIVKCWAKSRGVNATYQGTLSSYAYVLMCIHFLQQRTPAILPCLQKRMTTYSITVDDIECAYFDEVGDLHGFGSHNRETIAQLVWAFFNYWAYRHDYANAVISVRTGSILSKREKGWTRRVGNDRHLICIEDPFQISHDLGRVVDRKSIKVLREEFERAAEIMQHDPNPCVKLFERYIPS